MPLTIEVQNGNIVSIIDSNGEIITSEDAYYEDFSDYAPIDRLFPVVGAILKRNPDDVTVTYDTTYGFPTEIRVDYDKDFWDDELQLIVSGFHTLP